ncbi:MAG: hypothetical protein JSW27_22180 [Phycisphaerales bacterium]|nr:MAG: hypothetical protein JSW27_22180 [Phycisphaerales bacterium]
MKSNRRFYIATGMVILMVVVLWFSTSTGQMRQRYEVETQVYSTPEHRTDATRAIEAYERVMERYMDATKGNFVEISGDIRSIGATLDSIDTKLTRVDMRLERIERHLGILPPPIAPTPDPNAGPVPAPAPAPLPARPPSTQYR